MMKVFPVIDPVATGENILRLRKARGLTVRDLQDWFGFEEPQAIYKWQKGKSLPTVDNLYALGALFDVPMEEILVPTQMRITNNGQQVNTCCPSVFLQGLICFFGDPMPLSGCFEYGRSPSPCHQLFSHTAIKACRKRLSYPVPRMSGEGTQCVLIN